MRNAKFLLTAVMLVLASTVMAERGMVLLMKDNTKHGFAFVETPVVKVDKELTITTTNSEVKVQYADVQRIYFDEVGVSKTLWRTMPHTLRTASTPMA